MSSKSFVQITGDLNKGLKALHAEIPDTMKARGMTKEQVMNDVLLAAQPTKQFVTVEQVAGTTIFLCSDAAASITGTHIAVEGGWTAH